MKKNENLAPEASGFWSDPDLQKVWLEFLLHRKKLRKPMTPFGQELLKKKVEKYSELDCKLAVQIVCRSIENGWAGIFPLPG